MWPHHKAVITMRTHEATWPHHMPVFLNKAQSLLKNKSELFSVLHAPIYKVTSSSILNCTVAFTNKTQSISHTHKKLQPASLLWFLLARSLPNCCITSLPLSSLPLHTSGEKHTHKIYTVGFAKHHEVIHLPCKLPLAIHMQHAMITITLHSLNNLVVQQQ